MLTKQRIEPQIEGQLTLWSSPDLDRLEAKCANDVHSWQLFYTATGELRRACLWCPAAGAVK